LPSLNKIHGKTAYMGSKPQNGSVKTKTLTLQELKVALNEAVERQDFELAATLRDKINEIISEGGEL
jgi:protein arginine kinase activator